MFSIGLIQLRTFCSQDIIQFCSQDILPKTLICTLTTVVFHIIN